MQSGRSLGARACCVLAVMATLGMHGSPHAVAQTVINVPPEFAPSTISAGTTLNLLDGGMVYSLHGQAGSQINILGGEGNEVSTAAGAALQMSGGKVRDLHISGAGTLSGGGVGFLITWENATTNISGGAVDTLDTQLTATLNLHGVDFRLNGAVIPGLNAVGDSVPLNLQYGDVLTAQLADGTALAHHEFHFGGGTRIEPGTLHLIRSAAPPAPTPGVIDVTTQSSLPFVGDGQTAVVSEGGSLREHFRAGPGSRVEVNGGYVNLDFHAIGAEVVVNSGGIAHDFHAYEGTVVTVNGGGMNDSRIFRDAVLNVAGGEYVGALLPGATMNVTGGTILRTFGQEGSIANIYDGQIDDFSTQGHVNVTGGNFERFNVQEGTADVRGGVFNDSVFEVRIDAELTLHASDFRLNGTLLPNLDSIGETQLMTLGSQDVLSGVFADGTPFIFSGAEGRIEEPLRLTRSAGYTPGASVINVPTDPAPQGLHHGQTLILDDGGALPKNFSASHGSALEIKGGTVGHNLELIGATADVTGGVLASVDVFQGGVINLGGDADGGQFAAYSGGVVNVTGGSENGRRGFDARPGGEINISGGVHYGGFTAENARVNISGGSLGGYQQGSSATSSSVVTQSGGSINALSLYDGSTLTSTGGEIGMLSVGNVVQVELDGTRIGRLYAHSDSVIEVDSGNISEIDNLGSTIRLRGGALGDSHEWIDGVVELEGYDFQVNGTPVSGLSAVGETTSFSYTPGTTFTGKLSDGTPFIMSPSDQAHVFNTQGGTVRLKQTAAAPLTPVINVPSDPVPFGAGAGQTVIVHDGGELYDNFTAAPGSTVEINGGAVGANFEAHGSDVAMTGGVAGEYLDVFEGAEVTVSGGTVGRHWEAHRGGTLNVVGGQLDHQGRIMGGVLNLSAGSIGSSVDALNQAVVNISGGTVDSELSIGGGSIANVSGGDVGSSFDIGAGSSANVSGGRLRGLEARTGSDVDLSGGRIDWIQTYSGAHVDIRGGAFGDNFYVYQGTDASMYGSGFEINGAPVAGLSQPGDEISVTIAANQVFTGTLADGTPFVFSPADAPDSPGTLKLRYASPVASPPTIDVPSDASPLGVHAGQTLTLNAGGNLGDHFGAGRGSVVNILDGAVGRNFEAYQATVNVEGGQIGGDFDAFAGSVVNISGGSVGFNFDAFAGSAVNVDGGSIDQLDALNGSTLEVAGGRIGRLTGSAGSKTDWLGGVIENVTMSSSASVALDVYGVDFKLNGVPITGLNLEGDSKLFNLPAGGVLTGTLADGTPMIVGLGSQSSLANGTTRLNRSAPPAPPTPVFQQVSGGQGPFAIGVGQTLELKDAGVLPASFIAGAGSTLKIEGGAVGANLKAFDADIQITGGQFGSVNFLAGTDVDIYGGAIPSNGLNIQAGASIDIYGTQFLLNGQPIAGFGGVGDSHLLTQRNQTLTAILADGSTLQWFLRLPSTSPRNPVPGVSADAFLTLHLVPEPAGALLATMATLTALAFRRSAGRRR
jgi:hypothetical protein